MRGRVVRQRCRRGIRVQLGWFAGQLQQADVVSEGCVINDRDGLAYYGSTSIHCALTDPTPALTSLDGEPLTGEQFVAIVLADPHARLHLLRVAHRELVARAGAVIGPMQAEIDGHVATIGDALNMVFDIDASARVYGNCHPTLDTHADVRGQ
jgi:hypothetical protein